MLPLHHQSILVGMTGVEPASDGLKARCITVLLHTHSASRGTQSHICGSLLHEKTGLIHFGNHNGCHFSFLLLIHDPLMYGFEPLLCLSGAACYLNTSFSATPAGIEPAPQERQSSVLTVIRWGYVLYYP